MNFLKRMGGVFQIIENPTSNHGRRDEQRGTHRDGTTVGLSQLRDEERPLDSPELDLGAEELDREDDLLSLE